MEPAPGILLGLCPPNIKGSLNFTSIHCTTEHNTSCFKCEMCKGLFLLIFHKPDILLHKCSLWTSIGDVEVQMQLPTLLQSDSFQPGHFLWQFCGNQLLCSPSPAPLLPLSCSSSPQIHHATVRMVKCEAVPPILLACWIAAEGEGDRINYKYFILHGRGTAPTKYVFFINTTNHTVTKFMESFYYLT